MTAQEYYVAHLQSVVRKHKSGTWVKYKKSAIIELMEGYARQIGDEFFWAWPDENPVGAEQVVGTIEVDGKEAFVYRKLKNKEASK